MSTPRASAKRKTGRAAAADPKPLESFIWTRRHLLGLDDLTRQEILHILTRH